MTNELIPQTEVPPPPAERGVPLGALTADNPDDVVRRGSAIATALKDVIVKQKLYSLIQNKAYVHVEGWNTLGALVGVVPREEWVKRVEDPSGYEAYVSLIKASDGVVIGGASAMVTRDEKRWSKADDYAVRSMAITRATGKAYRLGFSWIMKLAGYEPSPAEEMPGIAPKDDNVIDAEPIAKPAPKPKKKDMSPDERYSAAWDTILKADRLTLAKCAKRVAELKDDLSPGQAIALEFLIRIRGGGDLEELEEQIKHEYTHDLGVLDDTLYAKLWAQYAKAKKERTDVNAEAAVTE